MSPRLARPSALLLLGVIASMSCSFEPTPPPARQATLNANDELRRDLETISRARILFGHQSVGRNLLAGLEDLCKSIGVPLRILEIKDAPPDELPGLFHAGIGRNGDPLSKWEHFVRLLDEPSRPSYDIAMMKLCYVDLTHRSAWTANELLEPYARAIHQAQVRRPDTRIAHVTMPLRVQVRSPKLRLKRWLGMAVREDEDNVLRNEFNAGLRTRFADQPIFDLAAIEATRDHKSDSGFFRDQRFVYTLAPEYSSDGGHLNAQGQRQAAIGFVYTLASILRERS
jgi:hypothetical protein